MLICSGKISVGIKKNKDKLKGCEFSLTMRSRRSRNVVNESGATGEFDFFCKCNHWIPCLKSSLVPGRWMPKRFILDRKVLGFILSILAAPSSPLIFQRHFSKTCMM